ncbi:MAG: zinc-binding dehydrogenase [Candidatus Lokiarchaeota archaeon]|nr:zinc-binding dehydrogenase [Candidatus Lokiarchaeota archaeon]
MTNNVGADVVVESTGSPAGINMALKIIRNRGLLCLKSTHGLKVPLDVTSVVVKELSIQGSRCGDFKKAIENFENYKIKELISGIYPLDRIDEAVLAAQESENSKIILHPFD